MLNNYLSILELEPGATEDDIKKAYKKLALKYHPDRNQEEDKKKAEEKFKKISEAYQILTNKSQQSLNQRHTANFGFMNANDLFSQLFSNGAGAGFEFINIQPPSHIFRQVSQPGQHNMRHINIGTIPINSTQRSSSIQIANGKKIETITEIRNGQIRRKTIITKL